MTLKQLIKNLKLANLKYIIQAKYKRFIIKEYEKHTTRNKLDDMLYAVYKCPECYVNNTMQCCGCNFKEAITSNKHCENGKW